MIENKIVFPSQAHVVRSPQSMEKFYKAFILQFDLGAELTLVL